MRSLNSVAMTGNLVRDPELRQTDTGVAVATLKLANKVRRKRGDEWVDKTSFFDVDVWGPQAEACARHLVKGSRIGVKGEIEVDRWQDTDGVWHIRAAIRQSTITFEGSRAITEREPRPELATVATTSDAPF
jgi:single-strand DNA-binding protein